MPSARAGRRPTAGPPGPPSASPKERHLDLSTATAGAACVALLGLSLSTLGDPRLGFFLFLAPALLLAVDAVVAVQATRRAQLDGVALQTDLVAGDHFRVTVTVAGLRLPLRLQMLGAQPPALVAEPPARGAVQGVAASRGVWRVLTAEVTSTGVCGLVGCVRVHRLELPRPLEVGPRPVAPTEPFPELGGGWGEGAAVPAADGDVVRGVREYLPGDRLRQVHWRATARHGRLVVKEAEEPQAPLLHLVLDLGGGGPEAEAAAGRAAWYGCEALRRGYQLVLTTTEPGRTVTVAAPTPLTVNRRLAHATPAGRPDVPAGGRSWTRVLLVSSGGDEWR